LSRPIRIQDLPNEYEKLIANDHLSDEFEVRFFLWKDNIFCSIETSKYSSKNSSIKSMQSIS
jgi:hypothetical protein